MRCPRPSPARAGRGCPCCCRRWRRGSGCRRSPGPRCRRFHHHPASVVAAAGGEEAASCDSSDTDPRVLEQLTPRDFEALVLVHLVTPLLHDANGRRDLRNIKRFNALVNEAAETDTRMRRTRRRAGVDPGAVGRARGRAAACRRRRHRARRLGHRARRGGRPQPHHDLADPEHPGAPAARHLRPGDRHVLPGVRPHRPRRPGRRGRARPSLGSSCSTSPPRRGRPPPWPWCAAAC